MALENTSTFLKPCTVSSGRVGAELSETDERRLVGKILDRLGLAPLELGDGVRRLTVAEGWLVGGFAMATVLGALGVLASWAWCGGEG